MEIEFELKDTKRAVRRSKSFAKYNARLKEYKEAGLLFGYADDPKWLRFLAKNSFSYHGFLHSEGWLKSEKFKGHPKTWGFNNKKAVNEALALA